MSEVGRGDWLDGARTLATVARAISSAGPDPERLAQVLVQQIVAVLDVHCALFASDGSCRAASSAAAVIAEPELQILLGDAGKQLGSLRLSRDPAAHGAPLSPQERQVAELIAGHGAIVLEHSLSRAALLAARAGTQLQLRRSVERFARLDRAGMLGVLITASDGRLVEVNETLAELLGYTRDELLAPGFDWTLVNADTDSRDMDARALAELRSTGTAALREKRYTRKDGSQVWIMIGSATIEGDAERTVSFVLDITERKRAEADALQRAAVRRTEATRAQLAAIVESTADAIVGLQLDGTITSWNRGATEIFGYASADMLGKPMTALLPPARVHEEREQLASAERGEVTRYETMRRRKDGVDIAVAVTTSPVYDAAGTVTGASKLLRDITAEREVAAALARAKDDAERASRELETFSYSVAHDLRAPLRGISGFATVLLEDHGPKLDADGRESIAEIMASARRMGELIDALLSLSRVTRSELNRVPTDLVGIAQAVGRALATAEEVAHRTVELVLPPTLVVDSDPRLARILLDNLLGNAWKFTHRTANPRIELGVLPATTTTPRALFVRDNGAGFDMAHASKLFAPFQRMHTVREFAGTGIGLATVQRIVHRHGGQIWAQAAVNRGATFFFTLPPAAEVVT